MIVVFGSINTDIILSLSSAPENGETVLTETYEMDYGGKGANQALAAARGGVKTALVGKVGDDAMGQRVLSSLRRYEVMTSGVGISDVHPTGMAIIFRGDNGENRIIVASGANNEASAEQVPDEILKPGSILLLQMELPLAENATLMERAKARGVTVILNLAPAFHMSQKALSSVDYLVINEVEARSMASAMGLPLEQDLSLLAKAMAMKGDLTCIITLGEEGVVAFLPDGTGWRVVALPGLDVVDTTGAGDCFCGTFAAALHEKLPLEYALRRASVAAGLSCTKKGVQESYPYQGDIDSAIIKSPQAISV